MLLPRESLLLKFHLAGSIATLILGAVMVAAAFIPALFPDMHKLLLDERVITIIPYLLFIALGEALFSIWYFLFRKQAKQVR